MRSGTWRWMGGGRWVARSAGALLLAAGAIGLSGCESGGRPLVGSSAVMATARVTPGGVEAGDLGSELDFFDALSQRTLVCHDDVIHAALLLGNGASAPTYVERIALANRLGYLERGFEAPPLEAATVGEVAQVMRRVMQRETGAAAPLNQQQSILWMASHGLLPAGARPYQGLTGPQLLTILGAVREAMPDHRPARTRLQELVMEEARPRQPEAHQQASSRMLATERPQQPEVDVPEPSRPARAAVVTPVSRTEPLPPPSVEEVASGEAASPTEEEPSRPARAREWVPGRPLRPGGQ